MLIISLFLLVLVVEIRKFSHVRIRKMAQEEGAFPVHVFDLSRDILKAFACYQLIESLFHTLLVMLLCDPLNCVHHIMWDPMIHQLHSQIQIYH